MAIGVSTRTVRETAPVNGSLPSFSWPSVPANSNLAGTILKYGLMMATVGSIESVLTLRVCNDITGDVTELRDSSQELAAQGLGNLMNSMFGATGGSVLIGQAKINIMNGARHRVSSVFAGICVLVFSVALTSFINLIPIGTLTGILFVIVLSTFQMKSFLIFRYGRLSDSASILIVTLLGVFYNLAIGIAAGVTLSAIVHAWDSGSDIDADIVCKPMTVQGEERYVKYVHVRGVLFFSSTAKFINLFSISNDPSTVILDFKDAFISDHSAVVAIQNLSDRFDQAGKSVLITNLAGKSHGRLHRTGNHAELKKQIIKSSLIQEKACDEESLQSHQASD
jgi:SulP family sulfate permease